MKAGWDVAGGGRGRLWDLCCNNFECGSILLWSWLWNDCVVCPNGWPGPLQEYYEYRVSVYEGPAGRGTDWSGAEVEMLRDY